MKNYLGVFFVFAPLSDVTVEYILTFLPVLTPNLVPDRKSSQIFSVGSQIFSVDLQLARPSSTILSYYTLLSLASEENIKLKILLSKSIATI